jgi:hypothetical protein
MSNDDDARQGKSNEDNNNNEGDDDDDGDDGDGDEHQRFTRRQGMKLALKSNCSP